MTTTISAITSPTRLRNCLAIMVLVYFSIFYCYLWLLPGVENEMMHWLTFVLLPLLLMAVFLKIYGHAAGPATLLALVGLRRGNLSRGLLWAIVLGLLLGSLQIMLSSHKHEIIDALLDGTFFYKLPIAFVAMLLTAGTTEEFFFRGVLQSRLVDSWGRGWLAILVTSVLFGIYHLPYAYLLESWPSHGDFGAAVAEGVIPAIVMGLVLGWLYHKFRNLLVPIVVHSLFNAFWALNLLKLKIG